MPDRDGAKRNRGYTVVYIKYIEYRKVHVSKRKIPRNRKVSGVFLYSKKRIVRKFIRLETVKYLSAR